MLRRGRGLVLVCLLMLAVPATAAAQGGPVILGGDDMTDHGQQSGGNNQDGWLYMEKAVGNIKPNVTRPNDNSIAALGSAAADPATSPSNAGAAIKGAADKNGMTVNYFNGATEIQNAFNSIANGSYNPAILWIAGDGAINDLGDTGCEGPGTEGQAITDNAGTINTFVSQGGGLMAHSTCYQWLSALLPGLTTVDGGSSDDLYLTPEGMAAFPGLTDSDINAGPWHNHFEGNFGGLQVLTRSSNVDDSQTGADAAVILGGAQVSIIPPPPPPPPPPVTAAAPPAPCSNFVGGTPSKDTLTGTDGTDLVKGLRGNDNLDGGNGDDCVKGGPGSDRAEGGSGNDQVNGGQRPDRLSGGPGDDVMKALAGTDRDVVNCGPGNDTARVEKRDKVNADCETVRTS
jgi:Ca2+-binding RTX toxin-like protein